MRFHTLLAAALLAGCATVPARPVVLDQAAEESKSAASQEAAQLAPQSFAEAEKLRREADEAQRAGDASGAQILAEQALAAYAKAFAQARLVRATRGLDEARGPLDAAQAELARLKEEQQREAADVQELETRIKAIREAPATTASGPADAAREAARREAVRALETEARLLCVSARLLAPEAEGLKEAEAALADLARNEGKAAPIDGAMKTRSLCLGALSGARRKAEATPATSGDALLTELAQKGSFAPVREDRGVVVTLRGVFSGEGVSKEGKEALDALGRVAAARPGVPVVLVLHNAEAADGKRDGKRSSALTELLNKHRSSGVSVVAAGTSKPVVDPRNKKDRARNERVEVVFVDNGV